MANLYSLEAFDRTMRDITGIVEPFGGKILIMGGDFRQVTFVRDVHVLHLRKNMRVAKDASYSKFLIRVGDGDEPCVANETIKVPEEMGIPWVSDASLSQLIDVTFPNFVENARDIDYMVNRALITPLNEYVEKLNDRQEYLNNIAPGGLPSHILKLKIGAPIMLLRNVDAKYDLCNGSRLKGFMVHNLEFRVQVGGGGSGSGDGGFSGDSGGSGGCGGDKGGGSGGCGSGGVVVINYDLNRYVPLFNNL
ncbi:uncharacterized protein LOC113325153 [Papaver somniferum]|uniref:uncharacterized protein LOC113325153 n=1 Tax=Papaver somniferum TaxID=3469 RepID=UPI000E6F4B9C|nr:uncharacterized protein LOC113325153 [Papaver somniferum]